jgi:uncharacterized membrane protein YgcG
MDLQSGSMAAYMDNPDKASEIFARHIHDSWGVGLETPICGGIGVLLFLSIGDRTAFFSRGSALEPVLTDRRLDRTIEGMKPLLLEHQFGQALVFAIAELDGYLLAGKPDWKENASSFAVDKLPYFIFASFFGLVAIAAVHERKQRREYAKVATHLDELDRARAEALQGRFQAKSCPICLESFTFPQRDGKGESNANETEGLICTGSDGLPLKLLRCGHVFDDTCWAEWISSGHQGKIDKCPICQQDVAKSPDVASRGGSTNGIGTTFNSTATAAAHAHAGFGQDQWNEEARSRALRQYTYDRNFRLLRLASRYPQYIRPHQIQSWTQVGFDGTLARDPSFLNNDPARHSASSSSSIGNGGFRRSGGGGASGFGGGFSGGGRGGRW